MNYILFLFFLTFFLDAFRSVEVAIYLQTNQKTAS